MVTVQFSLTVVHHTTAQYCTGVNHDELVKCAELSFSALPEGVDVTEEKSEYVGGKNIMC